MILTCFLIIFTLIKVSKVLEGNNWYGVGMKVMLVGFAMAMLFIPVAMIEPLANVSIQTVANQILTNDIAPNALGHWNNMFKALEIAVIAFAIFSFIYMVWLIFQSMKNTGEEAGRAKKWGPL